MATLKNAMGEYGLYDNDVTIIKKIGKNIKVCNLKVVRKKGLEIENKKNSAGNEKKMENSLSRAKSKLKEYALCNPWEYFVTLTLSPEKYDRFNLKQYQKDLSMFLNNYNKKCTEEEKVKYILVPEQHQDGSWHMHGLLKGIRKEDLYINENGYISWISYERKFGYISFGRIRDIEKTANYVMKYITKESDKNVTELNKQIYYCSKGLKTGIELYRGKAELLTEWDFETDDGFCRLKYFKGEDKITNLIGKSIRLVIE